MPFIDQDRPDSYFERTKPAKKNSVDRHLLRSAVYTRPVMFTLAMVGIGADIARNLAVKAKGAIEGLNQDNGANFLPQSPEPSQLHGSAILGAVGVSEWLEQSPVPIPTDTVPIDGGNAQ